MRYGAGEGVVGISNLQKGPKFGFLGRLHHLGGKHNFRATDQHLNCPVPQNNPFPRTTYKQLIDLPKTIVDT